MMKILPITGIVDYRVKALALYQHNAFKDYIAEYPSQWSEALRDTYDVATDAEVPADWDTDATAAIWYQLYNRFWHLLPEDDFLRWGIFVTLCDICSQVPNAVKVAAALRGGLLKGMLQKLGEITIDDDIKILSKKGRRER